MRRWLALLAFVPLTIGTAMVNASASAPVAVPGFTCSESSSTAPVRCTGLIPSFDGVPLDADLTLPAGHLKARPLMVMLHGYGNSKTEWESPTIASATPDKNDYNSASFVSRGYAVLTYTARGFHGSCGQGPLTPGGRTACARGWTHLADRRFEIRDTQFLAGLLADEGVANPRKIAVTGGSYGGGQSLLLAMQGDTVATVPNLDTPSTYDQASNQPWLSPKKHLAMHLVAAVPKYPWSDLIDSLLPNGRASDGVIVANGDRTNPAGIEKQSYVSYLFFSGNVPTGYYCPVPCTDPSADLNGWFARINAGEPYSQSDPVLSTALRQLRDWKSAYYQDALIGRSADHVPVFDIQGWTDNLFPEVEGVSLVEKLRAQGWPVKIAVADVGHPAAQNKAAVWATLNSEANAFLDHYMLDGPSLPLDSSAQVTNCGSSPGSTYTSTAGWSQLAPYRITFSSSDQKATSSAIPGDSADPSSDPIAVAAQHGANGACITVPANTSAPTASWDFPVTNAFTLLGEPAVQLNVTIAGTDAEIDAKLWDVAPDGSKTLVTRGAYRLPGPAGPITIDTSLQGNAWVVATGHVLRLEVTQNDAPYLRPDDLSSAITYSGVTLTLPGATAG